MAEWLLNSAQTAAYGLVLLALTAVTAWWCLRQYYVLIRKGYRPGTAGSIIGACVFGTFLAVMVAWMLVSDTGLPMPIENVLVFFSVFIPPPLVVTVTVALAPRRNSRRAGDRSVPFLFTPLARGLEHGLWWLGGAAEAGAVSALWWYPSAAPRFMTIGLSLFTLPATLSFYRKRAGAPTLDEVIATDSRAPVLYLRAFYQESLPFAWMRKSEMSGYTDSPEALRGYSSSVTFEQYFGRTVVQDLGPFVALGRPEDVLPPEGAARHYAPDNNWRQNFEILAESAAAIVMEPCLSENLTSEIAVVLGHGWHQKLFILTSPLPRSNRRFSRWMSASVTAAKGVPKLSWAAFANEMRRIGLQIDVAVPGPGAVISFDPEGRSVILIERAAEPKEFIAAIRHYLQPLSAEGA
jgi:hypothetical protein